MKKINLILLAVLLLTIVSAAAVSAQSTDPVTNTNVPTGYKVEKLYPPSYYLGTLREYMNDIQKLPGLMDESLCEKKEAEYKEQYQLLNKRIMDVQWLVDEMELKNTMNLQRIVNVFIRTKTCGVGKIATGYADTARELLNLEIEKAGLE